MKGNNTTLQDSGFIRNAEGDLVWQERHHHRLDENGVIYVTRSPNDMGKPEDAGHLVYKLAKIPYDTGCPPPPKPYFWSALWNTCVHSGHEATSWKWVGSYATIEEAIQIKLDAGWPVRMIAFSELCPNGIKFK